jgi:hypothetical protein
VRGEGRHRMTYCLMWLGRWAVRTRTVEAGSYGLFLLSSLHPEMKPSVHLSVSGLTPSQYFFLRTFGCPLVTYSRGLNTRGHIYIYMLTPPTCTPEVAVSKENKALNVMALIQKHSLIYQWVHPMTTQWMCALMYDYIHECVHLHLHGYVY